MDLQRAVAIKQTHRCIYACEIFFCIRNGFHNNSILDPTDMKKLCDFTPSFLLLKFSLILCSLTEPSCFWRIQNNEDNNGDLRGDCGFVLLTQEGPIDEKFYNYVINFR